MTATTRTRAPRHPWTAELRRLRWLETQIAALADDLTGRAADLDARPVSSWSARETAVAAALTQLATRITETIAASHGQDHGPSDLDWAQFHLDELGGHLTAAKHDLRLTGACQ